MQKGWAIIGEHGIYTGWEFTRVDAIARHVSWFEPVSEFAVGGRLNGCQRAAWKRRRACGDRVAKVEINVID